MALAEGELVSSRENLKKSELRRETMRAEAACSVLSEGDVES